MRLNIERSIDVKVTLRLLYFSLLLSSSFSFFLSLFLNTTHLLNGLIIIEPAERFLYV